jgi:hypothetical protein
MKRRTLQNLFLAISSLLISIVLSELGIRHLGSYDSNGNFSVFSKTLKPYHLPIKTTRGKANDYILASPNTHIMYDSYLGWAPRPNSSSSDSLYHYNSLGIRAEATSFEYSISPPDDTLRIVLIGDSLTHGDEVPFENTWGYYLENELKESNIKAQVINLGVGGYGMDQTFLHWEQLGHKFSPNLVIFGLQLENVKRNVNLIRPIYHPGTGLPFSKPRFILNDDELELINSPTISPEQVPDVIANIARWDLVEHEHFFKVEDYQTRIWLRSKLVSLALEVVLPNEFSYNLSEEPVILTQKIIQELERSVASNGGCLLLVHLPRRSDLTDLLYGNALVYSDLLTQIEQNYYLVDPQHELLEVARASSLDTLFVEVHYSEKGNEVIADAISKSIIETKSVMCP